MPEIDLVAVAAGGMGVGIGIGIPVARLVGGVLAVGALLRLAGGVLGVGALLVHRLVVLVICLLFACLFFCAPYSEHNPSMGNGERDYTVHTEEHNKIFLREHSGFCGTDCLL